MRLVTVEPRVPFSPPAIGVDEIAEVVSALESGWLSTGPRVHQFEEDFAAYIGAPYAVALNSCTAGLHLSLLAAGVGPGDEVITTPLTFCATANVIVHVGARPVFADVEPGTGNLDPAAAAAAVTARTRAIIPVHYGGRPADVVGIGRVASRHDLVTIEDAAHCVEGVTAGRKVGAIGDTTCFSFYATKNLTTGEGGMVTTASGEWARTIRELSLHGLSEHAWTRYERLGPARYELVHPGFKYNLTDLGAAIGLHQLRAIGTHLERRRAICERYDDAFADLPLRMFDPVPEGVVHAHHLYTILIDGAAGPARDDVAARLAADGVASSIHFPAVHLHRFYADRYGFREGQFPEAEHIAASVLSLPLSPALSDAHVDTVIRAVRRAFGA